MAILHNRVLVLFAHPALEKSRVNRVLIRGLDRLEGVTFHDLYEAYPDFDVDVEREQALLSEHDAVVLHHPFFWYSTPALVKQWEDLVLTHGWAYGSKGTALQGKTMMSAITTGGSEAAYQPGGHNRFTVSELLRPIEQTDVMHFAEFGVVMMLFLIGLELQPSLLWRMRGPSGPRRSRLSSPSCRRKVPPARRGVAARACSGAARPE